MQEKDFEQSYTVHLNPQQQEAVHQVDGPVLLLAVPGSGKTTVLVTRLGYMVYVKNIPPEHILTLTYTVAATNDMRERFLRIFDDPEMASRLEFRTINGICAKIIAWYSRQIGKSSFELESNEKRINAMLSGIYQKIVEEYPTETELSNIRTLITYIKNMRLDSQAIRQIKTEGDYDLETIYREYCTAMRSAGKMDYDDQMIYAFNILRRSPQTLEHFRDMYRYICVDEAQDTSKIQHEIIALLAGDRPNLFMVGDEDQSIYGFRAAWPEALLHFEKDHPGAKVLLMEQNYRSTTEIVEACDRFIQKNGERHEKHMHAARKVKGQIRRIELKGRGAQYTYLAKVAESISGNFLNSRKPENEQDVKKTAVLYRDNESGLPLIDLLDRAGIPFQIRNRELGFFTHRIVQDIRQILLLAKNPGDGELFLNVYYKMGTYMNKQTANQVCQLARRHSMGVLDAAIEMGHLSPHPMKGCQMVRRNLRLLKEDNASMAIQRITGPMGYSEYLQRSGLRDNKLAILRILARQEPNIDGFLNRLESLEQLLLHKESDPDCPLILSTIHGSKGLEYDIVYLLDAIDGVFPENVPELPGNAQRPATWSDRASGRSDRSSAKEAEERKVYEEERRLFYVGATRAKNVLNVFPIEGQDCTFISELLDSEKEMLPEPERNQPKMKMDLLASLNHMTGGRWITEEQIEAAEPILPRKPAESRKVRKKKEFSEAEFRRFCDDLGEGMPVTHKVLGEGVIVGMNDTAVTIAFDSEERRFLLEVLYMKDLLTY